jgi:hypothetical protein
MALGSDTNVHELLLSLVERLGHEQEVGWLDALTQEMVGVLDQLLGSPTVSRTMQPSVRGMQSSPPWVVGRGSYAWRHCLLSECCVAQGVGAGPTALCRPRLQRIPRSGLCGIMVCACGCVCVN